MTISLVGWPSVAVVVGLLAIVVTTLAVRARAGGRSRFLATRTLLWSLVATAGSALALHATGLVPLDIPRWFYVVAVLPFVGPALAIASGRSLRAPARVLAVACLPLGLLASVVVVNEHYRYWPTVGALLGRDHSDPMLDATTVLRLAGADPTDPATAPTPPGQGRLVDISIPGPSSGFHARTARLWLPPDFLTDPDRPRPVVELLGGTPSWTSDWTRAAGIDTTADRVAAAHGGEAPILVMVDPNGSAFGDTECVGASERYLTEDVPAFLESHFAVPSTRTAWAIGGYSEGGTCAVALALRHPERYSAFADLAGDAHPDVGGHAHTVRALFGGSEAAFAAHDPDTLLTTNRYSDLAGWFGVGRGDGSPRRDTTRLASEAQAAGIDVEQYACAGGHDFGFVGHALAAALPWLDDHLRA
jgi:S-formylglutathione hydrolase FrmB